MLQQSERSSRPALEAPAGHAAAIHALLARLLLKEADAALLKELARPEIADVLEMLEPGFAAFIDRPRWAEAPIEELAVEYARLFLLPRGVSPYAASWMPGDEAAVRQRLEGDISDLHDRLGVRPADFGLGKVPADHIGMLLGLTAIALQTDDSGDLARRCSATLVPWAPHFAKRVLEEAESPLYRAAAALLSQILADL